MSNTGWTPNITGLIRWDQLTDQYDSSQLAYNWTVVDAHDHTTNKGVKVPNAGLVNNTVTIGSTSVALGATAATIAGLTLTTPNIGRATATTINGVTITPSTGTLTLANDSTLATSGTNSITFISTGTTSITLPTTGTVATTLNKISDFASSTSSELSNKISDETGSGSLVFNNTPFFITPKINGSSTGKTTIASANAGASNYIITLPAVTGTVITSGDTNTVTNAILQSDAVTDSSRAVTTDHIRDAAVTTAKLATLSPDPTGTLYDKVTVNNKGQITAGVNIGYGTSLPGSPSVGDEYYYTADATNGVVWHLRYSGPTNKWEFLGGAPYAVVQNTGTSSTLTSTTYVYDVTTVDGPSITIPFIGTYRVEFGFDAANTNAGRTMAMGLTTSTTPGTSTLIAGAELQVTNADTNVPYTVSKFVHYFPLTAGTIYAQFKTSANTATVSNRWISVTPYKLG